MTLAPSLRSIANAAIARIFAPLRIAGARVPLQAGVAAVPILCVPLAAAAALLVAQFAAPQPLVVERLELPIPAAVERAFPDYEVEEFALLLENIFGLESERALQFSDWILEASQRHYLPPEIVASLIHTESSFRKRARSWAGAVGPAQVKPAYWSDFCADYDLFDPEHNIYCGAKVLAHYQAHCGDLDCALRLYNVGPGNLRLPRYQQAGNRYVARIQSSRQLFDEHTLL